MKKINADSFLQFRFVSDPGFSPDGRSAAFVVQQPTLQGNHYRSNLWLFRTEDQSLTQLTARGDAKSYAWTPDGKLLFSALRCPAAKQKVENGEELTAFYELDPNGGEARSAFTVPYKVTGLTVMDADHYVMLVRADNRRPDFSKLEGEEKTKAMLAYTKPAHEVFEEMPFWFNGQGYTSCLRDRIFVYTRSTGEMLQVTGKYFHTDSYDVQGNKILIKGSEFQGRQGDYSGLFVWDLESRRLKTLIKQDQCRISAPTLVGDVAVCGISDHQDPVLNTTQYPDFCTVDLKTGERRLLHEWDGNVGCSVGSDAKKGGGQVIKAVGDAVYFVTTQDGGSYLYRLSLDGRLEGPLTREDATLSFDMAGGNLLTCAMNDMKLAELYYNGQQVTHFNDGLLAELDVRRPEPHKFVNKDGVEIHGWCLTPSDYDPKKKYPAILDIHGGPRTAYGPLFFHEMQQWANDGYFVFFCNPRGSDGRGSEFGDISGKYGTIDYEDLMAFTDEMLKKYPAIDGKKLGVTGGSYGGFMTNWIVGHTDRFAAAATQRSIANWISFEHTSDIGPHFTRTNHGTVTRENVDYLWDISPLKYADKVKTPILIIHSDNDYRCWMVEGLSFFTALKMHGVPSKVCLFKGETHELSRGGRPRNRLRRLEEIAGWMNQYLK